MDSTSKPLHNVSAVKRRPEARSYYAEGYSPTMYAIMAAFYRGLTSHVRALNGNAYTGFSITSDGYVIAQPGRRESGDFLGSAADFQANIVRYIEDLGLTRAERERFLEAYRDRVVDWRPQAARGKSFIVDLLKGDN